MFRKVLIGALAHALMVGPAAGQTLDIAPQDDVVVWHLPGAQVNDLMVAWRAVQTQYEPDTPLTLVMFGYARREGEAATVTILVRRPDEINADGTVALDLSHRLYTVVVIEGSRAEIVERHGNY